MLTIIVWASISALSFVGAALTLRSLLRDLRHNALRRQLLAARMGWASGENRTVIIRKTLTNAEIMMGRGA